jgi:hypothetical protein
MTNCKKNPVRRSRRLERNNRPRAAQLEMPDFAVRLFGVQRLRAAQTAIVLQHWHD